MSGCHKKTDRQNQKAQANLPSMILGTQPARLLGLDDEAEVLPDAEGSLIADVSSSLDETVSGTVVAVLPGEVAVLAAAVVDAESSVLVDVLAGVWKASVGLRFSSEENKVDTSGTLEALDDEAGVLGVFASEGLPPGPLVPPDEEEDFEVMDEASESTVSDVIVEEPPAWESKRKSGT